MTKQTWNIRIQGYGTFDFEGTEQEAEEMRKHKAKWEGGSGMKWRKDNQTELDRLTEEMADIFDNGEGVPRELFMKRAALIRSQSS